MSIGREIVNLTRELCAFRTGVVAPENEALFRRIAKEVPLRLHRYPSGAEHNGWVVPKMWRVVRAEVRHQGRVVFDGTAHPLGVAAYARSFRGDLSWEDLRPHLVTDPDLPSAYVYHCLWWYRPWAADWALSVPYETYRNLGPGTYTVDLETVYEDGEMLVGESEHRGSTDRTVVLAAHTCHPGMANDGFAGVATAIRLFQRLRSRQTRYTYRLVLGPEHLGPVFYLRDRSREELERFVCGIFAEMPGTPHPIRVAATFRGDSPLDRAMADALRARSAEGVRVPWRCGAGNDETVWEAPGHEVPFAEVTRCDHTFAPFRGYHTSLDTADALDEEKVSEFFEVIWAALEALEGDVRPLRSFDGLVCLSNPRFDLYVDRWDPALPIPRDEAVERRGGLLDSLPRYLDGSMTALEIAERHGIPSTEVRAYLERCAAKGLIRLEPAWIERPPISRRP